VKAAGLLIRLIKDRRGVAGLEFALLAPIMIVLLLGSITLGLLFRDSKAVERANSAVGDVISRQTTVDTAYLQTCYQLFLNMSARNAAAVKFRVTSVKKTSSGLTIAWSYAVSPEIALTAAELAKKTLPLVSDNDSLVLVETAVTASPVTAYLGGAFGNMSNTVTERPRFTAAIAKTD